MYFSICTVPSICNTPVAVSHLVDFLFNFMLKLAHSTNSLLPKGPEEPESTRPRYVLYFFEFFFSGIATKISELGTNLSSTSFSFSLRLPMA